MCVYVCVSVPVSVYIYIYTHTHTKLRIHKITAKSSIEIWKWSLGTEEKGETTFRSSTDEILRPLLEITKPDKEKNQCIRQKTGAQNIVMEIKQYQKKWLQHVQRMDTNKNTKTSTTISTKRTKEHRTTEEEMEGPTSSWGSSNRKHA